MDRDPNYNLLMERELKTLTGTPRLLLHSCCGPCSSSVLERLSPFFDLTVLYYNPNIYPRAEFEKRLSEQRRLIAAMPFENPVELVSLPYDHGEFLQIARGMEQVREGGARCERCFRLRLTCAARYAREHGFAYFTTTLSVSPHKDSRLLNRLGADIGEREGIAFLHADFKKRGGFDRTTALSAQYALYRQTYCGCEFSTNAPE